MTFKTFLPVWYGLELETVQNVSCKRWKPKPDRLLYFLNYKIMNTKDLQLLHQMNKKIKAFDVSLSALIQLVESSNKALREKENELNRIKKQLPFIKNVCLN